MPHAHGTMPACSSLTGPAKNSRGHSDLATWGTRGAACPDICFESHRTTAPQGALEADTQQRMLAISSQAPRAPGLEKYSSLSATAH